MKKLEDALFAGWKELVYAQTSAIFVSDGIVDEHEWENAPVKVLYLLKEVNGAKEEWDERDYLAKYNEKQSYIKTHSPTIDVLTKWQYGISHGGRKSWLCVAKEACQRDVQTQLLRQICLVNIKKTAGGGLVDWNKFDAYFKQEINRRNLKEQLSYYYPDVVICGGTAWYLCQVMGWDYQNWKQTSRGVRYYQAGSTTYVDFCHPNNRGPKNLIYFGLLDALSELGCI